MGKMHYDPTNEYACNDIYYDTIDRTDDITPFYLAKRGECSFVQKVRNMEYVAVSVGVVIDDHSENIENVLMSDDGTGGGIRIPSMLIGQKDGNKLTRWFESASDKEKASVVMQATFVMPEAETIQLDYWMTSSSDRALDFIEDYKPMQDTLGSDLVSFEPHYVFWECPNCDERYINKDCYGGGRYCAVEPSNENIKGQEIMLEDLRQKCLW